MAALPAEEVFLLDLRSAFGACSDSGRFLLRGGGDYRRRRLGFFALRSRSRPRRCCLYRWWLHNWRNDGFLLRLLLLDYVESSGSDERPAVNGRLHKHGCKNLDVAGVWIGAVIVILVELVKVALGRELRRSRQHECLVL